MTDRHKRFFLSATVLLAVVVAVSQVLFAGVFVAYRFPVRIASILVVWIATCMAGYWVMKTATGNTGAFNRVFMLQTTVKLLLYLVCIVVYLMLFRQHGVAFTVHFLAVYIIFAFFEAAMILKFVRNNHDTQ